VDLPAERKVASGSVGSGTAEGLWCKESFANRPAGHGSSKWYEGVAEQSLLGNSKLESTVRYLGVEGR